MANREFLMLAQTYNPKRHGIGGWWMSEKLDGFRCYWDGGITRGLEKTQVPWANTAKDSRYIDKQYATGLWSRYGNVIHAPSWWLDKMPLIPFDGELWVENLSRQDIASIVKRIYPDTRWDKVKLMCFDLPPYEAVFRDGRINNPNYKKMFSNFLSWVMERIKILGVEYIPNPDSPFETRLYMLKKYCKEPAIAHKQVQLPYQTQLAQKMVQESVDNIKAHAGEGVIVRSGSAFWVPKRVQTVVKVKPLDDDEGIIVGFISGRETDKGSKLLGMMGAMILDYKGKKLELSGFTDEERRFSDTIAEKWAEDHPGCEVPNWVTCKHFKRGEKITFQYRGLTDDGIPQEARYLRRWINI